MVKETLINFNYYLWFSAVLLCMYWRIIYGLYHILSRVWSPLAAIHDDKQWNITWPRLAVICTGELYTVRLEYI